MSSGESDEERAEREKNERLASARASMATSQAAAQQRQQQTQAALAQREASAQGRIFVNFRQKMQKAKIYKWTTVWEEVLACGFNPNQLTIDKANKIDQKPAGNKNVPDVSFGGGQPATLNVELFFDTTATGEDVRTRYTSKLYGLMMLTGSPVLLEQITASEEQQSDEATSNAIEAANQAIDAANAALIAANAPPKVKFVWGRIISFEAYITKLSENLLLFLPDGTPVRSKVKVTFQQSRDETIFPPQNPTSASAPRKIWVVNQGETLDWIAYKEYGNPAHWRHIARVNQLADPRRLQPGQVLKLTPLPEA